MRIVDPVYGLVSLPQRQMYKSRKVSVEDHEALVEEFGSDSTAICKAVAERSASDGQYRPPMFGRPT